MEERIGRYFSGKIRWCTRFSRLPSNGTSLNVLRGMDVNARGVLV